VGNWVRRIPLHFAYKCHSAEMFIKFF